MTGPFFQVSTTLGADVCGLRLVGELDLDGTAELRSALADVFSHRSERVVLDLKDLLFCDCAGLNVLLEASVTADRIGSRLSVEGVRDQVARLFSLIGADELLADRVPPLSPGTV
ncbi:MAG TPA: STAS domain-containing protein [Streptomyces sp.]